MKSQLLSALLLVAAVLVESSAPFSAKATSSFKTETSVLEIKTDGFDDIAEVDVDSTHCTAVGILDLSETLDHGSVYEGSKILLRNRLQDDSNTDECWGVKKATDDRDANNNLVLSSVIGISCDGLVIKISDTIVDVISSNDFANADMSLETLDNVLLSLADSLVHRFQSVDAYRDTEMQILILLQGKYDGSNDAEMDNTTNYIQKYLDRAISKLQQQLGRRVNDPSQNKCRIEAKVKRSPDSAAETALQELLLLTKSSTLSTRQLQAVHSKLELIDEIPIDHSLNFRNEAELIMATALSTAEDDLYQIETRMDDEILEGDDVDVPMPEFGSDANALLFKLSEAYANIIAETVTLTDGDKEWITSRRIGALKHVAGNGLHRLYCLHLQNLRDHFGRTYERVLDKTSVMNYDEMDGDDSAQAREMRRRHGAKRAEEGFLNAAFSSIPAICQDPQMELGELYSCTEALRGLLEDMFEATQSRGIEEEEWNDLMDISAEEAGSSNGNHDVDSVSAKTRVGLRELVKKIKNRRANRGPAKWYERLAAKAFVIGVNYVQGWIVLQTLRREARRRDLTMPKFPLF